MKKMLSFVAAMIAALACAAPAPAQELPEVKVIVFPGANNWPIWAAQEQGYFTKAGIQVALTLTLDLADASYKVLLDPSTGLQRKAELDIEGLRTVLALRSEYGQPRKTLTDPAKYYESSYYKKALGN